MQLISFREILLKKIEDNTTLRNLVRFMRDEVLVDLVTESLEKMARASSKGDHANFAVRDFATEMDPQHEPNMIHDALSHHASHYKTALQGGKQDVANQHAKQFFRIMDLTDQAQKHSMGKLSVDAVSPHAWERNAKTTTFADRTKRLQDAKSAGETLSPADDKWLSDNPVTRGFKKPEHFTTDTKAWRHRGNDFSFLQQAPHPSYEKEIRRHGHDKAYPMEHVKVNDKFLDIENVEPKNNYESHPFDHHPIMEHFEMPAKHRQPEHDKGYVEANKQYSNSPHMDRYFDAHDKRAALDSDKYANRGKNKSDSVHGDVEPMKAGGQLSGVDQPTASSAPKDKGGISLEERQALMDKLPQHLKEKFARLFDEEN